MRGIDLLDNSRPLFGYKRASQERFNFLVDSVLAIPEFGKNTEDELEYKRHGGQAQVLLRPELAKLGPKCRDYIAMPCSGPRTV